MIKEFLESLKLKDLVFFVLIIVLFCMYFKKNKKEGFAYSSPTNAQKASFKADVEEALGENIQAIKNLGNFAGQLLTSDNVLDLSAVDLKVNSLEVAGNSIVNGSLTIDGKLEIIDGNVAIRQKQ